jgi:hypothetical protein
MKPEDKPYRFDEEGNKERFKFTFPNLKWLIETGEDLETCLDEDGDKVFFGQLLRHLAIEAIRLKKALRKMGKKYEQGRLGTAKYQRLYTVQLNKRKATGRHLKEVLGQLRELQEEEKDEETKSEKG